MNTILNPHEEEFSCPECGNHSMHLEREYDTFEYGTGKDQVHLKTWVILEVCDQCNAKFNTEDADKARHDEICRHLQLLTPKQVLHIRVTHQMSQAKFAEITGIGVASLSRWESGQMLQNKSHDNLLRLCESKINVEFLERRNANEMCSIQEIEREHKTIAPRSLSGQKLSTAIEASAVFALRKAR